VTDRQPPPANTAIPTTGDSIKARAARDPLLTATALQSARRLYLGRLEPSDPRASPLHGDTPPVLLHVGEDEILLDDARRYVDRVWHARSMIELHVWKGVIHVFPANIALLQAAREALDSVGDFLQRNLASEHVAQTAHDRV